MGRRAGLACGVACRWSSVDMHGRLQSSAHHAIRRPLHYRLPRCLQKCLPPAALLNECRGWNSFCRDRPLRNLRLLLRSCSVLRLDNNREERASLASSAQPIPDTFALSLTLWNLRQNSRYPMLQPHPQPAPYPSRMRWTMATTGLSLSYWQPCRREATARS